MATRYTFTDNSSNTFTPFFVMTDVPDGGYYVFYYDPNAGLEIQPGVPIGTGNYTLQVISPNLGDTILYYDVGSVQRAAIVVKVVDATHVDLIYFTDALVGQMVHLLNVALGTSVGNWNFTP